MPSLRNAAITAAAIGVVAALPTASYASPTLDRGDPWAITVDEQTAESGLWDPLLGMYVHTTATADLNGDGWLDLFVGGFYKDRDWASFFRDYDERGATEISPNRLLFGGPDGFTSDASFPEMRDCNSSGSAFADIDNDGDLDLLVSCYYDARHGGAKVVALRNDDTAFTQVGEISSDIAARTLAVSDYDGDGNLDVFVMEDRYSEDKIGHAASSRLYRGDGNFGFTDSTTDFGLPDGISGLSAVAADLNGDAWPDLFVSGSLRGKDVPEEELVFQRARMFVNNGDGTFTEGDASEFTMLSVLWRDESSSVAVGDLNRDGRMDLVMGNHPYPMIQQKERELLQPIDVYLNEGNDESGMPHFRDVTDESGMPGIDNASPKHITLADMDNDGWLDIVTGVSVGDGTKPAIFRHTGLVDGVPQFQTPDGVTREERTDPPEETAYERAGSFRSWPLGLNADFNNDGRVDMFTAEWFPELPSRYFENHTKQAARNFVKVDVTSDTTAFGATVNVYRVGDRHRGKPPIFSRQVLSNESYGTGALHVQHAGIGKGRFVEVEVVGPAPEHTRVTRYAFAGQTVQIDLGT